MENLPWFVSVLIIAAGIVVTLWLRVSARSAAIRRAWSGLAAMTGCTFNDVDPSTSQSSVTGNFRRRPIRLDSDLDYTTTRIFLKCSNPSRLVLSVVGAATLYHEENYRPVIPRAAEDLPVYGSVHAFTALETVQGIKLDDSCFDGNFVVQSTHESYVVTPLVEMLVRFGQQSAVSLHHEMLSFNIGQAGIGVVLNRLASKLENIPRLQSWFHLVSDIADIVEKTT